MINYHSIDLNGSKIESTNKLCPKCGDNVYLTENIFKLWKLSYYSTAIPNIASGRIAVSLDPRPVWVEVHSTEKHLR